MGKLMRKTHRVGIVFFCTIGWICAGSAIGAGEAGDAGIFDDDSGAQRGTSGEAVKVGSFGQVELQYLGRATKRKFQRDPDTAV